jgi:hypothetical protein
MWGRPPFFIGNNYAIDVRSLVNSRNWYAEKLGFARHTTARKMIPGDRSRTCILGTTRHLFHWLNYRRAHLRRTGLSFSSPRICKKHTSGWRRVVCSSNQLRAIQVETVSFGFMT